MRASRDMRLRLTSVGVVVLACSGSAGPSGVQPGAWRAVGDASARVEYQDPDAGIAGAMLEHVRAGRAAAMAFFGESFASGVTARIFPDRASLTAYWRSAWNQPSLVPECWMVASATKSLAVSLSPHVWGQSACGHDATDPAYVRRILSHEIVHVLHGQINPLPEVNSVNALKWLNEGTAYYAAGQLTDAGRSQLSALFASGYSPTALESLPGGAGGYAAAASVVAYIDMTHGRDALRRLLRATTTAEALGMLNVSETALLQSWREFAR